MSQSEWKQQVRDRRNAETKNVKAALIKAGYKNVRVGHDRGTAWNWLTISVDYYGDYFENLSKIQAIAVKESGRTGRSAEDISVTLNRAADDVEGARKARLKELEDETRTSGTVLHEQGLRKKLDIRPITDSYKVKHDQPYPVQKLTPEERLLRDIFGTPKPKFDLLNMESPSKYKN